MPKRIQRRRTKGWRMPPGAVYVGRPTIYGNPWVGPDAVEAYRRFIVDVLNGVLYADWAERNLDVKLTFRRPIEAWRQLRGMLMPRSQLTFNPACWCGPDKACHGDIFIEMKTWKVDENGCYVIAEEPTE